MHAQHANMHAHQRSYTKCQHLTQVTTQESLYITMHNIYQYHNYYTVHFVMCAVHFFDIHLLHKLDILQQKEYNFIATFI